MGWGSVPERMYTVTPPGITLSAASWSSLDQTCRPDTSCVSSRSGRLERGGGARGRERRGDLLAQLVRDREQRRTRIAGAATEHLDRSLVHLHELARRLGDLQVGKDPCVDLAGRFQVT